MKNQKKHSLFGWLRRMVMGASKEYADEVLEKQASVSDVEEIVSPG